MNHIISMPEVKQQNLTNTAQSDGLSMTSREIADLCAKDHKNVIRDIRVMLEELGDGSNLSHLDRLKFERIYKDASNRDQTEYCLPKDLTLTLVSGYNVQMRKRIIDRWLELEAAKNFSLPKTFSEALRALADTSEKVTELETKIAADIPKVVFAEAVRDLDGACPVDAIAKTLGTGRNKFLKKLREDGVLMKNNLPFQRYIDRDYFRVVEHQPWVDKDGKTHPSFSSMVTGRGQVWLQHKYSNSGV